MSKFTQLYILSPILLAIVMYGSIRMAQTVDNYWGVIISAILVFVWIGAMGSDMQKHIKENKD